MIDICIITKLTENRFDALINSIIAKTDFKTLYDCKFHVCYTGDKDEDYNHIDEVLAHLNHDTMKVEYNFAKNMNALAAKATGDTLLFLNDDIELIDDCITHCKTIIDSVPDIGTVGCKLLYPLDIRDQSQKIQHAGVVCILDKVTKKFKAVTHALWKVDDAKLPDYAVFGNTGAFLMIKKALFDQLGGFDERFKDCFEDVALNALSLVNGKLNVCCGSVAATHYESTTRKQAMTNDDVTLLKEIIDPIGPFLLGLEDYKRTILER